MYRKDPKALFFGKMEQKKFVGNWKDLIKIYEEDSEVIFQKPPLRFAAFCPTNVELQKVSLTLNIFHEKTKAVLVQLNITGTGRFLYRIT